MTNPNSAILDKKVVESEDPSKVVVGTGPFKLNTWDVDQVTVLDANEDYWRTGVPHLDQIEIRIIPDEMSILAGLRAGTIDWALINDPKTAILASSAASNLKVERTPALAYHILQLNSGRAPLDDVRVRLSASTENSRRGSSLGFAFTASVMRTTRSSMLEVLRQDYVRTARGKGLSNLKVVMLHAFPNAMIPVITIIGIEFGYLLGGAVIVEEIFSLPGLGRLLLNGIQQRDYAVVQGTVLFVAFTFVLVGIALGTLAGYIGGNFDNILMRIMDIFFAFPAILLALAIVAALGPGMRNTIIAISIVYMPIFARVARGPTLTVKSMEFITAAHSLGARGPYILRKHILPNITAPLIVQVSLALSWAILTEAGLSFLGLGSQPPEPSWGNMLSESRTMIELAPWLAIFPGLAIMLCVLGFNLLGDGLRDVLDPRLRRG